MPQKQKGSGTRKFGRTGRRPSHKAYNAERRWEKNRKRRMERHAKERAKKQQQ